MLGVCEVVRASCGVRVRRWAREVEVGEGTRTEERWGYGMGGGERRVSTGDISWGKDGAHREWRWWWEEGGGGEDEGRRRRRVVVASVGPRKVAHRIHSLLRNSLTEGGHVNCMGTSPLRQVKKPVGSEHVSAEVFFLSLVVWVCARVFRATSSCHV